MMSWIQTIAATLLLAAIPPLDTSQEVRLESAQDGATTVNEAAFYALLENAEQWPSGETAGAIVPDFHAMRDDPAGHRGQLTLIEGRALGMLPEHGWARSGWEQVRGVILRIDDGADDYKPTADEMVIVYLVDPPDAVRYNQPVRLVARFHKIVRYAPREGEGSRPYLSFVGREVAWMGERPATGISMGFAVMLLVLIIIGMILLFWRIWLLNRSSAQAKRTTAYLAEKRRLRQQEDVDELDEVVEQSYLPEDPVDALDTLKRRHREEDQD